MEVMRHFIWSVRALCWCVCVCCGLRAVLLCVCCGLCCVSVSTSVEVEEEIAVCELYGHHLCGERKLIMSVDLERGIHRDRDGEACTCAGAIGGWDMDETIIDGQRETSVMRTGDGRDARLSAGRGTTNRQTDAIQIRTSHTTAHTTHTKGTQRRRNRAGGNQTTTDRDTHHTRERDQ